MDPGQFHQLLPGDVRRHGQGLPAVGGHFDQTGDIHTNPLPSTRKTGTVARRHTQKIGASGNAGIGRSVEGNNCRHIRFTLLST